MSKCLINMCLRLVLRTFIKCGDIRFADWTIHIRKSAVVHLHTPVYSLQVRGNLKVRLKEIYRLFVSIIQSECYISSSLYSYMSGGTSGSSTNPSEKWSSAGGGASLDASTGPSLALWRGTMFARSTAVRLLGSTSSLSGTLFFLSR